MICEHILGNIKELNLGERQIEYIEIEWEEAFKRIHRKETDQGREVGIRLDDSIVVKGMLEGDVLYLDDSLAIVVTIKACKVILIEVDKNDRLMAAKVCYEIGNRHAPLFYGDDELMFIIPFNEPMFRMLSDVAGVMVREAVIKLDFERKVSNTIFAHQHRHELSHDHSHESEVGHDHEPGGCDDHR